MSYEVNRRLVAPRPPLPTLARVDPITAGIIRGAFETICFEVATHLGRCASSAIINQSNERNASVIDAHGRLAGISVGIPQLLFISPLTVRYGLENRAADDWGPGDVLVGNDPEHGGGHLPDYNVYAPVFDERGEIVVIQALQAHQGDTGGKDPGGFSVDAREIWAEGRGISTVLEYPGERRAVCTWVDLPELWDFRETLEVYGSRERVLATFPTGFARGLPSTVTLHGMDADRTPWRKELSWHDNPFLLELREFRKCVLEGATVETDGRSAVHDVALVRDIVLAYLKK